MGGVVTASLEDVHSSVVGFNEEEVCLMFPLLLEEWRTGSTGCVPLRDEDLTTKHDGEFRRLNTLAHYCVPEGALMAIVPKKCSMVNLALSTEKIAQSSRFGKWIIAFSREDSG